MKNTLTNLALAGTLALGLTGCMDKRDNESVPDKVFIRSTSTNREEYKVEVFVDFDHDGKVDQYIIGPADERDPLLPSTTSEQTKRYLSQAQYKKFIEKYGPTKKPGIVMATDKSLTLALEAEVMSPELENRVNNRYNSIRN